MDNVDPTEPAGRFLRVIGAMALMCAFEAACVIVMETTGHTGTGWWAATFIGSLVLGLRLGFAR